MSDERGPHSGSRAPEWSGGGDPADEWILDPVTGEYRMRLPGEGLPALPEAASWTATTRGTASREDLLPVPVPRSRVESRAAARGGGNRGARRGRRRNSGGGGGLWLAWTLGVVGLLGCGTGGYLLLHQGGSGPTDCAATAKAAPSPSATKPSTADAGPATDPGPTAQPIDVRVTVLDGSGQFGEAENVLTWMQNKQLYTRTSNGGPVKATATTSLVYAPNHADQARTLAAAMHLPDYALHGTGKGTGLRDPMVLTLGKDFKAAGKPLAPPSAAPAPARSVPSACGG